MEYLFVLGRNIELSVAELKSFLEKEEFNFRIISQVSNGILIEINKPLEKRTVDKLGGTISIGVVLAEGDINQLAAQLNSQALFFGTKNKLNYTISDFNGKNFEAVQSYLKKRFRDEQLKATEKHLTGKVKLQTGEYVSKVSSKNIDEQYFVFENSFGRITEITNAEEIEKRDMNKPVRRNELSISPRLAKILINLSQVKSGETLLDPFCGVGGVLQEALLQNIKVVGVDKDKDAIEGAGQNLEWFRFNKTKYFLVNDDSTKVRTQKVEAIATEPDLGEILRKSPSPEKAKEQVGNFENLIIKVLNNLKNDVSGKIVFTAPFVQIGKKKFSCNFQEISAQTNLKIADGFPIEEFREKSFIGREIVILCKAKNLENFLN